MRKLRNEKAQLRESSEEMMFASAQNVSEVAKHCAFLLPLPLPLLVLGPLVEMTHLRRKRSHKQDIHAVTSDTLPQVPSLTLLTLLFAVPSISLSSDLVILPIKKHSNHFTKQNCQLYPQTKQTLPTENLHLG